MESMVFYWCFDLQFREFTVIAMNSSFTVLIHVRNPSAVFNNFGNNFFCYHISDSTLSMVFLLLTLTVYFFITTSNGENDSKGDKGFVNHFLNSIKLF